jgi:peptidoglycan/xylan/chitin deacetylase (PgdA/CDA1 family)
MSGLFGRIRALLRSGRPKPLILMYHRIAEPLFDPWGLAVAPSRFALHLQVLKANRTPLGMEEFVTRFERGNLPIDAVAVTFDDGYRDNLTVAKAHLEAIGIPATVFLTTGTIGDETAFWWDELADLVLGAPDIVDADLAGGTDWIGLGAVEDADNPRWRVEHPPQSARQTKYLALWEHLRLLDVTRRKAAMASIRRAFPAPISSDPDGRPMSRSDVSSLIANGLVTIGAHTVNHPALTRLSAKAQVEEILLSRRTCEELTDQPVQGFAYPFGDLDETVKAAVRSCNVRWACSTHPAPVHRQDMHELPRLQVRDWDADQFAAAIAFSNGRGPT